MKKLLILAALVLAMIVTAVACDSASTPADTDAPATTENTTEAPATEAGTDAPAADTEAPAADTNAPAADTDAPAADTDAPAADTDAPAADTDAPAADTEAPVADTEAVTEADTDAPTDGGVKTAEYTAKQTVRVYAHLDAISSGETTVQNQTAYNTRKPNEYQPLLLDGWTTGADRTITLSGWIGANGGQDELVWCVTPLPEDGTLLTWTSCSGATYAMGEAEIDAALKTGPGRLNSVILDNARFGNATIDLSEYAGQTISVSVAVKCSNSDVVVAFLCFTNLTVAA